MSFWRFANPHLFERLVSRIVPVLGIFCAVTLSTGLIWGFFFTSEDYVQGHLVKVIFLHVPSALMAINIWLMMLVTSLIWLVRRHRVSILAAKAAAPIGLAMTVIALLTGALWGEPIWGKFWAWDPRLTSFLILFLHYISYILLWNALGNKDLAADLTSLLCLVGSVFALLSRYAVNFWSQGLHQGATLSLDQETNIHNEYYIPLLFCILGFALYFVVLVLVRTRTEIYRRRALVQSTARNW